MRNLIASLAALSLAASANAQTPAAAPEHAKHVEVKSVGKGMAGASRVEKLTATVKAIDPATREITLEAKGQTETIKAGPAVKRFDEIAVGDTVVVQVEQGLLLEYQAPAPRRSSRPRSSRAGAPSPARRPAPPRPRASRRR